MFFDESSRFEASGDDFVGVDVDEGWSCEVVGEREERGEVWRKRIWV